MKDKPVPLLVGSGLLFLGCLLPWWSIKFQSMRKVMNDYQDASEYEQEKAAEEFGQARDIMKENKDWYQGHTASADFSDDGGNATVFGFGTWTGKLGLLGALVVPVLIFAPVPIPEKRRMFIIGGIGVFLSFLILVFWLFSPGKNVGEFLQQGTGILLLVPWAGSSVLAVVGIRRGRACEGV